MEPDTTKPEPESGPADTNDGLNISSQADKSLELETGSVPIDANDVLNTSSQAAHSRGPDIVIAESAKKPDAGDDDTIIDNPDVGSTSDSSLTPSLPPVCSLQDANSY